MKRIINVLVIVTFSLTVVIGQKSRQNIKINPVVINALEFGLDTGDATGPIRKALEACKIKKATRLVIPKGVYHFYPSKAVEKYFAICNNDNGLKRIAFFIEGMRNFEIDGHDAIFIFHGKIVPFIIYNSSNISVKRLSIDWVRPFHSEGEVVAVDVQNKTFDLKMSSQFPYEIQGRELIYKGEGWEQGLQENIFFDPATRAVAYDDTKYVLDPWTKKLDYRYSAKEISKGIVRIVDTIAKLLPKVGWVFVTKGYKEPNRTIPGFAIQQSFDISFSDINIYHVGSMGFIAEKSGNISLNKIRVTTTPESGRYLSLGSDATHFVNCKGYISIRNSLFENMHDDAVNVQGVYSIFENIIDQHTVGIRLKHFQQFGFSFAAAGDSIRLVDRETLLPYKKLKVKNVRIINEEYSELTFSEDISKVFKERTALENISWRTDSVLIEGCTVRNNRARSLLISVPGKIVIRNNTLSSEMACIAIGGEANSWAESGPVNDLLIEENLFKDCCTSESNQSVIQIAPSIRKLVDTAFYHSNIRIIRNDIQHFDKKILSARSVKGLVFADNKITLTNTFTPFYMATRSSVELTNCSEVDMHGNAFLNNPLADIKADAVTKKGLRLENNKGVILK